MTEVLNLSKDDKGGGGGGGGGIIFSARSRNPSNEVQTPRPFQQLYINFYFTDRNSIKRTKEKNIRLTVDILGEKHLSFFKGCQTPRLDFRRFLESGHRSSLEREEKSVGSFPEQRLVIEPTKPPQFYSAYHKDCKFK